jgi:putative heme-binding domain-containing protein
VRVLKQLMRADGPFPATLSDAKTAFIRSLSGIIGRRQEPGAVNQVITLSAAVAGPEWQVALLDGLAEGLGGRYAGGADTGIEAILNRQLSKGPASVKRAALRTAVALHIETSDAMHGILTGAKIRSADPALSVEERLAEIGLLALGIYADVGETLLANMAPQQPPGLQKAAAEAYAGLDDVMKGKAALARYRQFSPEVKAIMLDMFLSRAQHHDLLLSALESGALSTGELNLDLEQRRRLLWHGSEDVRQRAAALFGDHEFSNRKEVVARYIEEVDQLEGDAQEGAFQYEPLCAKCHLYRGQGAAVGPDLSMAFSKGMEDLLTSILDPNAAIESQYTNYIVETTAGNIVDGIITAQTPTSVTLTRANGETNAVARSDIATMRTDGLSLMPEGLEEGLDARALADLLAYLRQHHHR